MRLILGIVVVAMGVVMTSHTSLGYMQILAGAVLVWLGVRDEINKAKKP
jgi:hypothetical protein